MSRGGRGGFGRGRGGGPNPAIPAGLTFADLQNIPREGTPLYPPLDPMPMLDKITDVERELALRQIGFGARLRHSAYYVVEEKKTDELERYSDKYKPAATMRPTLRAENLNKEFFPSSIWDAHFYSKRKLKSGKLSRKKAKLDWSKLGLEGEGVADNGSDRGSQEGDEENAEEVVEDYDEENDEDNDYENNYFDNGEEDNEDDLGDGGAGEGGADDAYD